MQIIVIHKGNIRTFTETINSILGSELYNFVERIIAVVSDTPNMKDEYCNILHQKDQLIFNQDKCIYSAMNIGLKMCEVGHVIFLNSGDFLTSQMSSYDWTNIKKSIVFLPKILIDGQQYTARSHKVKNHQNMVYFLDSKKSLVFFDEEKGPLADAEWIKTVCSDCLEMNDSLAIFTYGGISTRPRFLQAIKYYLKYPNKRYFKLVCKATLISLGFENISKRILISKYG